MTETFKQVYTEELTKAVRDNPKEYAWPIENVPVVVDKMMAALVAGTANKDGQAIKATCKRLGIKYTYKGIKEYFAADTSK